MMAPLFLRGTIDEFIDSMDERLVALGLSAAFRADYERQARAAHKVAKAGPQPLHR